MRLFKKLGVLLSMAAVATMFVALPVSAEDYRDWYFVDKRESYIQTYSKQEYSYTSQQKKDLWEQCRVKDPDSWYLDSNIYKSAFNHIHSDVADNYVGDLRYLLEFGLFKLPVSDSKAFNYGIVVINKDNGNIRCCCKCSSSDYDMLLKYKKSIIKSYTDDGFICSDGKKNEHYFYDDVIDFLYVDITEK